MGFSDLINNERSYAKEALVQRYLLLMRGKGGFRRGLEISQTVDRSLEGRALNATSVIRLVILGEIAHF